MYESLELRVAQPMRLEVRVNPWLSWLPLPRRCVGIPTELRRIKQQRDHREAATEQAQAVLAVAGIDRRRQPGCDSRAHEDEREKEAVETSAQFRCEHVE